MMRAVERVVRRLTGLDFVDWRSVVAGTIRRAGEQRLALVAAGWAFWATISFFPALIVLLTIYGMLSEASEVERQVSSILRSVSRDVQELVTRQLTSVVRSTGLGWSLALGLATLLWTASSAMANAIKAVAFAYGEADRRSFVKLRVLAIGFTIGALLVVGVAAAAVTVLPLDTDRGRGLAAFLVGVVRWGGLVALVAAGVTVLYRFAPQSRHGGWEWAIKAALVVSVAWAGATALFSIYIRNFSNYANTYGALAGLIILMIWLFLSAYLVIAGAAGAAEMWEVGEGGRDTAEEAGGEHEGDR